VGGGVSQLEGVQIVDSGNKRVFSAGGLGELALVFGR